MSGTEEEGERSARF